MISLKCTPGQALHYGKAAEHLVCADLIMSGYIAFLADQGSPYDLVLDAGDRLLRVQVKSTTRPMPVPNRPGSGLSYRFGIRRAGRGAKRVIGNDEFELLALVALDIKCIAYLPISDRVLQCINLRIPSCPKNHGNKSRGNMDEYTIDRALSELSK